MWSLCRLPRTSLLPVGIVRTMAHVPEHATKEPTDGADSGPGA